MKNLLIVLLLLTVSCKSKHEITEHINQKTTICPENSNCTIELIPNKSLEFKTDNFGILYPVISDGEHVILKYTFQKKPIKNTQDSNYSEIIYAELNKTISNKSLQNKSLQTIKLHFGRLCYCKGTTGYFPIKKGDFEISNLKNDKVKIALNFSISEVPQIISNFEETISLKSN
ncbi:hypothetical protein [Lutibacter citreus]|uniref:hypothetical protein n=1 Tax=Lutibacter citreus TaxID=2138210 RepID=UPI0013007509|nr:hypothetical protein [Lutibacter citreus]